LNLIFIADYFTDQVLGGAEVCNEIVIEELQKRDHRIYKILAERVTLEFLNKTKNLLYIISNFAKLKKECVNYIVENGVKYLLYMHDHAYTPSRNPGLFKDYVVPKDKIINEGLFEKAKVVFGQTKFHCEIMQKNLPKCTNIVNLGGSLWRDEVFDYLSLLSDREKESVAAIMASKIGHKNTLGAVKYCEKSDIEYKLIKPGPQKRFLRDLSKCSTLVFLPLTPETCSRIVLEAKMLGLKVITNNKVGAVSELWFPKHKGKELIKFLREVKRREIINQFEKVLI